MWRRTPAATEFVLALTMVRTMPTRKITSTGPQENISWAPCSRAKPSAATKPRTGKRGGAREHGIEKGAKEKLFHQRRKGNAEDAECPGFGGRAEKAVDWQLLRNRQEMSQNLQTQRKREARQQINGNVGRRVPVDGGEKIGTAALAGHEHIHVGEDEKVRQGLSGDDD